MGGGQESRKAGVEEGGQERRKEWLPDKRTQTGLSMEVLANTVRLWRSGQLLCGAGWHMAGWRNKA